MRDLDLAPAWMRPTLRGTLRLAPPAHRLEDLAADYALMQPMFLRDPPPFSDAIRDLEVAEKTVDSK